jgi:pimeloyl-ACP methyl ester carboxylesterase
MDAMGLVNERNTRRLPYIWHDHAMKSTTVPDTPHRRRLLLVVGICWAAMFTLPCASLSSVKFPTAHSVRLISSSGCEALWTSRTCFFMSLSTENDSLSSGTVETYEHDGWSLTYRYKLASAGYESKTPLLLIHPVGIGLSSWFWEKFFEAWQGPELYAPDLIGCGVKNGADAWDPDKRGLSFPLGWAQGCEALLQTRIIQGTSGLGSLPLFQRKARDCIVVCQGGLAPVGVMLAARNPSTVQRLVLTSPPTWKDMTSPVPEVELSRNYAFLRSPVVAPVAFGILETRWAIEFFSNLFLFQDKCDQRWLDLACDEIAPESRSPVAAFNAGFCNHRSFQEELEILEQATLILSGDGDRRTAKRQEYQENMRDCTMISLPGLNVLPWESPMEVVSAIKEFCYD